MSSYRYYALDSAGHLRDAAWFEAESDKQAVAQIETEHSDQKCEIWQGQRLVASLRPKHLEA